MLGLIAVLAGPTSAAADERRLFSVVPFAALSQVEPLSDGGFLVTRGEAEVLRVDRRWRVTLVAGRRGGGAGGPFGGDGGAAKRAYLSATDVAALPNGGFLIADLSNCRVRRVGPDGIISTVAGPGPAGCRRTAPASGDPVGDGGPAVAASLVEPTAISETPDGGFLVADGGPTGGAQRVRRVAPDGTISTVAGNGAVADQSTPPGPYAGPATEVALRSPYEVEASDDGGFLFVDRNGVHRVGPDGFVRTVVSPKTIDTTYLIGEGGAVYESDGMRLREMRGGSFEPLLRNSDAGFFPVWGGRLPNLRRECCVHDIQPIEDGGFVITTQSEMLLAAPPGTSRLGATIAREALPALQRRSLVVRSTIKATLRVALSRRGRVAVRARVAGKPGLNRIALPRKLPAGLYRATLRARSADGSAVGETRRVLIGALLPGGVARDLVDRAYSEFAEGNEFVSGCRRFGRRRVDCVLSVYGNEKIAARRCALVVAVVLRRTGHVMQRRYRCAARKRGYFSGRPAWTHRAEQAPSLDCVVQKAQNVCGYERIDRRLAARRSSLFLRDNDTSWHVHIGCPSDMPQG